MVTVINNVLSEIFVGECMNRQEEKIPEGMKVTTKRPSGYSCRGKPIKFTLFEKFQLYLMGYRFGGYLGIYKTR